MDFEKDPSPSGRDVHRAKPALSGENTYLRDLLRDDAVHQSQVRLWREARLDHEGGHHEAAPRIITQVQERFWSRLTADERDTLSAICLKGREAESPRC